MKSSNAVRLISTKGMSRDQWLTIRNGGIGSSDAAVAVGLSRYKSPLTLWLEKTGRKACDDLSNKESVFWGTTLEPIIAQVYAERTGQKVRRVNAILQHPKHVFMRANLDRAVGADGVLEIKTAGLRSSPQWEEGIPPAYQCQVLHQLAVTGKSWADVAVLIGGQEFRIYRLDRDDAAISALIEQEAAFWAFVQRDEPPPPDGSESSAAALSWLYPNDAGSTIDFTESVQLNTLFRELLDFKRQRERLEFVESAHRQTIQAAMAEASTALFSGGRVSWRRSRDGRSIDIKRLLAEHPEISAGYGVTVPGSRRFLMQVDRPKAIEEETSKENAS